MVIPPSPTEVQAERPRVEDERPGRRRDRDEEYDEDYDDRPSRAAPAKTSGKAIIGLVLGLLAFGCSVFTGIPAVIFGILGMKDINRSQGRLGGNGMAITGIVTGIVGSLLSFVVFIPISIGLILPAVQKVRQAAANTQSANNLRQMGFAMQAHHDQKGSFPVPAIKDNSGKPLLSWRV